MGCTPCLLALSAVEGFSLSSAEGSPPNRARPVDPYFKEQPRLAYRCADILSITITIIFVVPHCRAAGNLCRCRPRAATRRPVIPSLVCHPESRHTTGSRRTAGLVEGSPTTPAPLQATGPSHKFKDPPRHSVSVLSKALISKKPSALGRRETASRRFEARRVMRLGMRITN